jgi:hypothetical protein
LFFIEGDLGGRVGAAADDAEGASSGGDGGIDGGGGGCGILDDGEGGRDSSAALSTLC